MTPQKQPTNRDIMDKLESMEPRLVSLENWKIAVEAAKQALKDFQREHPLVEKTPDTISSKALAAVIATLLTLGGVITVIIAKL